MEATTIHPKSEKICAIFEFVRGIWLDDKQMIFSSIFENYKIGGNRDLKINTEKK